MRRKLRAFGRSPLRAVCVVSPAHGGCEWRVASVADPSMRSPLGSPLHANMANATIDLGDAPPLPSGEALLLAPRFPKIAVSRGKPVGDLPAELGGHGDR
jgi:hypothetical protein